MKTFSEYINEAKQNYIFGGTDNRAPSVPFTAFNELKEGDTIYQAILSFAHSRVYVWCGEFIKIEYTGDDEATVCYKDKTGYNTPRFPVDELSSCVYIQEINKSIWATDKDVMIDTVREKWGKKFAQLVKKKLDELE